MSYVIAALVILSIICHLSQLYLHLSTVSDICDIFSATQRIVGKNGQKSVLACILQIQLNVAEHPDTAGILHLTYYILGHTKSFSGTLNSSVVWVLEHRVSFSVALLLAF